MEGECREREKGALSRPPPSEIFSDASPSVFFFASRLGVLSQILNETRHLRETL